LDGLDIPFLEEQNNYVGGVVVDQSDQVHDGTIETNEELWKLNVVLALVSSWITVTLTGWGSIQAQGGKILIRYYASYYFVVLVYLTICFF